MLAPTLSSSGWSTAHAREPSGSVDRASLSSRAFVDGSDIERAYAGGEQARRELAERLWTIVRKAVARKLFPIARSSGRDPSQDLDDFVNGVFLSLFEQDWRVLRRFDPAQGTL